MAWNKIQIALFAIFSWIFLFVSFRILSINVDPEIFFCFIFLGILFINEMVNTTFMKPQFIRYLQYVSATGGVILGAIIVRNVLAILAS